MDELFAVIAIITALEGEPQPQPTQIYNDHIRYGQSIRTRAQKTSEQTVCAVDHRTASNGIVERVEYNCQGNILRIVR